MPSDQFAEAQRRAQELFDEDQAEAKRVLGPPIGGGILGGMPGLPGTAGGWMAGVRIPVAMPDGTVQMLPIGTDGVIHPRYPATASGGPYTVWMDNNHDGWSPTDCDTLAGCFDEMRAVAHSGKYRITRDVAVEIREAS